MALLALWACSSGEQAHSGHCRAEAQPLAIAISHGSTVSTRHSFGLIGIANPSGGDIQIDAVSLRHAAGVEVIDVLGTPLTETTTWMGGPGFPPSADDFDGQSVDGTLYEGATFADDEDRRHLHVIVGLETTADSGGFRGVEISYREGDQRHELCEDVAWVYCFPVECSEPVTPERMEAVARTHRLVDD